MLPSLVPLQVTSLMLALMLISAGLGILATAVEKQPFASLTTTVCSPLHSCTAAEDITPAFISPEGQIKVNKPELLSLYSALAVARPLQTPSKQLTPWMLLRLTIIEGGSTTVPWPITAGQLLASITVTL